MSAGAQGFPLVVGLRLSLNLCDRRRGIVASAEGGESGGLADATLQILGDVAMLRQERASVLTSLTELLTLVGEPGSRLLD